MTSTALRPQPLTLPPAAAPLTPPPTLRADARPWRALSQSAASGRRLWRRGVG